MSGGKMIQEIFDFSMSVAALMLTGCTSAKIKQTAAQQETDAEEDSGEKKIQIGLTVDSFVIETVDPRQGCIRGNSKGYWERR